MAAFKLPRGLVVPLAGTAVAIAVSVSGFFEGSSLTAYRDSGGVVTICDGHTGPEVHMGQVATPEQCGAYHQQDVASAGRAVDRLVKVPLPVARAAALYDFTFNLGPATLARSSVLRKLNAGDTAGACAAISLYHYVGQADCTLAASGCAGIVTRRNVERWLCELDL